jgi:hypothetical protein
MAFILATIMINIVVLFLLVKGNTSSAKGASFCHVARIKQFIHDIDVITEGNQK